MTDINWPEAFAYYSARLADMWPGKVAVGTALSSLCLLLGMDEVLFYVLLATLTGEMLTRIAVHCKRNKSLCRGLQHGLARYICYGLFLLMAVAVQGRRGGPAHCGHIHGLPDPYGLCQRHRPSVCSGRTRAGHTQDTGGGRPPPYRTRRERGRA